MLLGVAIGILSLTACVSGNRAPSFELRDDRGQAWSFDDQPGAVVLFFGYTHCPDTCPLTLAKLSRALTQAGPAGDDISVAFVTVDPARDTPAVLHEYLSPFGSRFVGLTGTASQIEAVERSYHVWAAKLPSKTGGYGYNEAHSSTIFFIDRSRNIASLHDPTDSEAELVRAIRELSTQ